MTDLERRALLGDRQAQEECTRQWIVLPCPCCGSANIRTSNWGMWRCWCSECRAKSDDHLRERYAIKQWNTRPAPPIGRCVECKFANTEDGGLYCELDDYQREECDFCSDFEPKAGEEDAEI